MPRPTRDLPPFAPEAVCPKCACAIVAAEWCSGLTAIALRVLCAGLDGEHMHRRCARCAFRWFERPLDLEGGRGAAAGPHEIEPADQLRVVGQAAPAITPPFRPTPRGPFE